LPPASANTSSRIGTSISPEAGFFDEMMSRPTRVKLCGTTSKRDVDMAVHAGADFFGVVIEVPESRRTLSKDQAAELFQDQPIPGVALVRNRGLDDIIKIADILHPFAIQLVGKEGPELVRELKSRLDIEIWKSLFIPAGQKAGDLEPEMDEMIKAYTLAGTDALLIDTVDTSGGGIPRYGGTGKTSDWETVARLRPLIKPLFFLSGGLRPENVAEAIRTVRPDGIDLASGVESAPGIRDPDKVKRLMREVLRISGESE
jgi:phosphoribosylanthranilate isomerase